MSQGPRWLRNGIIRNSSSPLPFLCESNTLSRSDKQKRFFYVISVADVKGIQKKKKKGTKWSYSFLRRQQIAHFEKGKKRGGEWCSTFSPTIKTEMGLLNYTGAVFYVWRDAKRSKVEHPFDKLSCWESKFKNFKLSHSLGISCFWIKFC